MTCPAHLTNADLRALAILRDAADACDGNGGWRYGRELSDEGVRRPDWRMLRLGHLVRGRCGGYAITAAGRLALKEAGR